MGKGMASEKGNAGKDDERREGKRTASGHTKKKTARNDITQKHTNIEERRFLSSSRSTFRLKYFSNELYYIVIIYKFELLINN